MLPVVYNNVTSEDEHKMVHKIRFYFYKYYIIHSTLKNYSRSSSCRRNSDDWIGAGTAVTLHTIGMTCFPTISLITTFCAQNFYCSGATTFTGGFKYSIIYKVYHGVSGVNKPQTRTDGTILILLPHHDRDCSRGHYPLDPGWISKTD